MIEKKNQSAKYVKPTLVSNSARYKIGSKEYTATDVASLKPKTSEQKTGSTPKQSSHPKPNAYKGINTSVETVTPSRSVHTQDGAYRPSSNTQATVQTSTAPKDNTYKPSKSAPITSPPTASGAKTASELSRASESRVQAQTENYYSTNAVEAVRTPKSVDAIKTGATPSVQTSTPRPGGPQPMPHAAASQQIKTAQGQSQPMSPRTPSSPIQTPAPSVPVPGSSNIRTDSQVKSAVQQSVQTQTQHFHSNNAFSTERTEIRSGIERTPRTVEAVKTSAPLTGKQQPVIAPLPQGGSQLHTGVKTSPQAQQPSGTSHDFSSFAVKTGNPAIQAGNIPGQTPAPSVSVPGSSNIRTDSQVKSAVQQSVQTQTQHFHSNNAFSTERTEIRSGIERSPRTVEAVKTSAPLTGKQQPATAPQPAVQGGNPQQHVGIKTAPQTGAGSVAGIGRTPDLPSFAVRATVPQQVNHITVQAGGNIRTASQMANVVEQKVRSQTEFFHSNNAVVAGIKQIQNDGKAIPFNVSGIKTGMAAGREGAAGYKPNIPSVGAGKVGTVTLSRGQMADVKANMRRLGITDNVTTGNVQYGQKAARAFQLSDKVREGKIFSEIRAGKDLMGKFATGKETTGEFIRSLGATAKYTIGNEAAAALQKWKASDRKELLTGGRMLLGKAEGALLSQDDLGTQAAGGIIATGLAGATAFKGAQWATEVGVESVRKVGNGVYQVVTTTGRATITVGATVKTMIHTQTMPLSREAIQILRNQAKLSGLNDTKIVKGIVNRVDKIKSAYAGAVDGVKKAGSMVVSGAKTVKTAVTTGVKIVHGVAKGTMTVHLAKAQMEVFRQRMFKGIQTGVTTGVKTAAGYAVRGAAKGAGVTLFRGLPKAGRLMKGGVMTAAGMMMASEDYAVQGLGNAITAADIGVKTTVLGAKAAGYTVKTAVNTGKATYNGVKGAVAGYKFIKNYGLNAAWQRARIAATRKAMEVTKSVISALIQGGKLLLGKYLMPLLLICLLIIVASGAVSGLFTAIGAAFGGVFQESESGMEYTFYEYLMDPVNGIPPKTEAFKQDLAAQIEAKKTSYHIVRFFSDMYQADVLDPSYAGVSAGMPSDSQLATIMQPLLHAIVLVKYDLEPTQAEINALITEMYNELFTVEQAPTTEQCGQAVRNGEGEPNDPCGECNEIHALDDCPNPITGYHSTFTCSDCDGYHYICNGHTSLVCTETVHTHIFPDCHSVTTSCGYLDTDLVHIHDDSCYDIICGYLEHEHSSSCYYTDYCEGGAEMSEPCSDSTEYFDCTGYRYCGTHSVYTFVLHVNGLSKLVKKYFTDPIAALEAIDPRTEDQEAELQKLKDGYEILQVLVEEAESIYGDIINDFVNGGGAGGAGGGAGSGGIGGVGGTADAFYGGSGLMTPVNFTALTSPFGWRIHPVSGDEKFHSGVDLAAPHGTPIYAAMDGTVTGSYYDDAYGGGNTVIIVHGNGYQTGYCHMAEYIVSSGQTVTQGECIGYVGNTGVSTGPHLHLTVRLNGELVNPEQHIDLNWKPGDDGFEGSDS